MLLLKANSYLLTLQLGELPIDPYQETDDGQLGNKIRKRGHPYKNGEK